MNARTLLNKLCDEADKGQAVNLEFPGLCGNSNIGTKRCQHGHISLSVTPETAREVALLETHRAILITVPKEILSNIMGK